MPPIRRIALLALLALPFSLFAATGDPEPLILVGSLPAGLVQETELPGGNSTFTLLNAGGGSSTVSLQVTGGVFSVSPLSATLGAGESRSFAISGSAQPPGMYSGTIEVSGAGVPFGTSIPVRLFSANRPSEPPRPRATVNRIDLASAGTNGIQRGTLTLRNEGPGTVRGLFYSDVPWIVPDADFFEFPGFGIGEISFSIDTARRPPGTTESGSLILEYLLSPFGKGGDVAADQSLSTSTTRVTVVSTLTPQTTSGPIPNLGGGEVALFAPGVGRVQGSVGLFISDVTLTSLVPDVNTRNVSLYYTPANGETRRASFGEVSSTLAQPLGDLVRGVFGVDGQVGTLQVRAPSIEALGVNASIFTASDPAGTFGTAIPVFRSDRAAASETVLLAGLQKTATSHTNLFVQETSGNDATVRIRYLDGNGVETGSGLVTLSRFAVAQIGDPLTPGTVTAMLTRESGEGRFVAYATPVDRTSGDFWSVADWSSTLAYDPAAPVVLPVVGAALGANDTDFRTDVTIANAGSTPASGTLHYYAGGAEVVREVTLAGGETRTWENIARTLFGIAEGPTIGYAIFNPASGEFRLTSRNYNYVAENQSSYGTAVPAMAMSQSMGVEGNRRVRFGGLADAAAATVAAGTPATFRTNAGIAEVSGAPVKVRAILNYSVPSSLVTAFGTASAEFDLAPRQLLFLNRISEQVLGNFRGTFGDLRNLQLDLEVIEGEGRIVAFTSTIDNGTGDSVLRIE